METTRRERKAAYAKEYRKKAYRIGSGVQRIG